MWRQPPSAVRPEQSSAVPSTNFRRGGESELPSSMQLVCQLRDVGILCDPQGPVYDSDEPVWQESDVKSSQTRDSNRSTHAQTNGERFFSLLNFAHEHGVRDLQIVVEPEDRIEHAK